MGLSFLSGTFLCRKLLKTVDPENIFLYAISFFTLLAAISAIFAFFNVENICIIIIPSFFMFLGCGVIYPTAIGKGISLFRHLAGSGSAVINLINTSLTSLTVFIMSFMYADNAIPLTLIYLSLMIFSGFIYYFLIRSKISSENEG